MRMRGVIGLLAAVSAIGLALIMYRSTVADRALVGAATSNKVSSAPVIETRALRSLAPMPRARVAELTEASAPRSDSLAGSSVDGDVSLDPQGKLLPTRELRRLYDYFLVRVGEVDLATIRATLVEHLHGHYSDAVVAQVLQGFDNYVALLEQAARLPRSTNPAADLEALHELRLRLLGSELAAAFFAEEEAYTMATLARIDSTTRAANDRGLGNDAANAALAPEEFVLHAAATDFQLATAQSQQLADDRVDAETRRAERTALWGAAAAERLAQLDAEQADWEARLAAYRSAHAAIVADVSLNPSARAAALQALLQRSFNDDAERRRAAALQALPIALGSG